MRRYGLLILILTVVALASLQGQSYNRHASPLQIASSENTAHLQGAQHLFAHPAMTLFNENGWSFHLSGSNRYSTDIRNALVAGSVTSDHQAFGVALARYGITDFSRHMISGHYTRRVSATTALGISGYFYQWQTGVQPNRNIGDLSINVAWQPHESMIISLLLDQPLEATREPSYNEGRLEGMISKKVSELLTVYSAMRISWDGDINIRPGFSYQAHDILQLYLSLNTDPTSIGSGMHIMITDALSLDVGYNNQQELGSTFAVGVSYQL